MAFAPELAAGFEGYEESFFGQLAELEAGNFWFRSRNRLLSWALRRFFPKAQKFLEIGCGTGFVLQGLHQEFPHLSLAGSDIFSTALKFTRKRLPHIFLFQMDARRIPFFREFDVVGAFDVVEHIKEDELVFEQMFQAVKPGGGIMVTVPQHGFLWSVIDEDSHHQRRYSRPELIEKVQRAGFSIVHLTSFVTVLLPLMMLSRALRRRTSKNYDLLAEFRISSRINRLLETALTLERAILRSGISLPAGGSLLLVGKRDS
jgi:SAM-dependent methyltransferase